MNELEIAFAYGEISSAYVDFLVYGTKMMTLVKPEHLEQYKDILYSVTAVGNASEVISLILNIDEFDSEELDTIQYDICVYKNYLTKMKHQLDMFIIGFC